MASRLNPYLNFRGEARAALDFYQQVFGGEVIVNTFAEFGGADSPSANQIMHGQLETPSGYTLMCSDVPDDMEYQPGTNMTVCLSGDDNELRGYWEGLSASGKINTPLEKQVWGDEYGECLDKFGVRWMVNITQPR